MKQSTLPSNNLELINISSIEFGALKALQPLYVNYPNPLPYPPLVAMSNNRFYLIDGVKRITASKSYNVLLDKNTKLKDEKEQIQCWLTINRTYRQINLLERTIFTTTPYKNTLNMPLNIQHFIAANEPSHSIMTMLDCAPKEILQILDKILLIAAPNNSTLKLLLDNLFDLNSREQLKEIENMEFFKLIEDSGIKSGCNRIAKIRKPNMTNKDMAIRAEINSTRTDFVKINYDESFEADHLTLKAEIRTEKDIENIIRELGELQKQNKIKKLLDIYEN